MGEQAFLQRIEDAQGSRVDRQTYIAVVQSYRLTDSALCIYTCTPCWLWDACSEQKQIQSKPASRRLIWEATMPATSALQSVAILPSTGTLRSLTPTTRSPLHSDCRKC